MAFTISIELPSSLHIRNDSKGKAMNLDLTKVPANVIADLVTNGATVVLNNTFNGGGKERLAADKEAALDKRMAAWYAGTYTMIERGESQYTAMRDQYADEQKAKFGRSRAEVDKIIKQTVESTLGKDKPASFSNFLEAVASQKLKAMGKQVPEGTSILSLREEIEKALAERTAKAAEERAKIAASVQLPDDLGL